MEKVRKKLLFSARALRGRKKLLPLTLVCLELGSSVRGFFHQIALAGLWPLACVWQYALGGGCWSRSTQNVHSDEINLNRCKIQSYLESGASESSIQPNMNFSIPHGQEFNFPGAWTGHSWAKSQLHASSASPELARLEKSGKSES